MHDDAECLFWIIVEAKSNHTEHVSLMSKSSCQVLVGEYRIGDVRAHADQGSRNWGCCPRDGRLGVGDVDCVRGLRLLVSEAKHRASARSRRFSQSLSEMIFPNSDMM